MISWRHAPEPPPVGTVTMTMASRCWNAGLTSDGNPRRRYGCSNIVRCSGMDVQYQGRFDKGDGKGKGEKEPLAHLRRYLSLSRDLGAEKQPSRGLSQDLLPYRLHGSLTSWGRMSRGGGPSLLSTYMHISAYLLGSAVHQMTVQKSPPYNSNRMSWSQASWCR